MTPDQAFTNLQTVAGILNDLGIRFWLSGGALLGAWRDGDFPDGDHTDIDLGAWSADTGKIPELKTRALTAGFDLYYHWEGDERAPGRGQEVSFIKDGGKVEVFFWEQGMRDGQPVAWCCRYVRHRCVPVVIPLELMTDFEPIMFRGMEFLRPARIDEFLTFRYGDWRTPVHASVYRSDDPEQFLALDPSFRFWHE